VRSSVVYLSVQMSTYLWMKVPVVVVFTKYDKLIDRVDRILDESALEGLSDDEVKELVKQKAEAELREMCTKPFEEFAGLDIPYATISSVYPSLLQSCDARLMNLQTQKMKCTRA
jgi:hypothetical protein